jgi:hypothetical protein
VPAAYREHGFSVELISLLSQPGVVSRVAACAQMVLCAPNACIGLVFRQINTPIHSGDLPLDIALPPARAIIDVAFSSCTMKYSCATGTIFSSGHFLAQVFCENQGVWLVAKASIPFRSGKRWAIDYEAIWLSKQVFGFLSGCSTNQRA